MIYATHLKAHHTAASLLKSDLSRCIDIPTLMIWGEADTALNINCTVGTEDWVPNLTLHRLPGVSHWVQQEAPEAVNRLLEDWLE